VKTGAQGNRQDLATGNAVKPAMHRALPWVPAFAGMTMEGAGMTMEGAGMTMEGAGMTMEGAGMTEKRAGVTKKDVKK